MSARSESFHAVGEQIAATLREAHGLLEAYAEGESAPRDLQKCADLLHAVRGALHMAEVYGAALLAEEMEQACRHLYESRRAGNAVEEGIEALSRAMVQLPAYIERIMDGGRDIPLVMLPLLNDLRAARAKPLLSESTLLLLNGAPLAAADAGLTPAGGGEDISDQLGKLRPQFQLGLLGWIKGGDSAGNLRRMAAVIERLEQAAASPELYRLWLIVGALLEALADKGLDTSIALKRLLGQVDREIKRLQQGGESDFVKRPPAELMNNLLYYIARSRSSGPRCARIKAAYNLAELAPAEEQVDRLRESLTAPSPQLMKTVAGAIREDLARAKDVLDIYVRTGMEDAGELEAQVGLLQKIADTLGVLGLGKLREAVARHSGELAAICSEEVPDPERLVALAADLLAVEDTLEGQLVGLVRSAAAGEPPPVQVDSEYRAVIEAVLRECRVNLAHVKESISQVLERPDDRSGLDAVPELLGGVRAGLGMLGYDAAVDLLGRIGQAIRDNLQHSRGDDPACLNRLADAIVSLEYYMETLQAGRKEPVYMLENAGRSLAVLERDRPEGVAPAPAEPPVAPDSAPVTAPADTGIHAKPIMEALDEQPDLELLEIFIEEAREEIEAINRHFPAWCENQADEEAIITMRRSFHTLKGSGRMVGAQLFGEYAWNIENLLNRVISKTVPAGPEMLAFLQDAIAATPQLLEQLEVGTNPAADIAALAGYAARFADGVIPEAYAAVGDVEAPDEDSLIIEELDTVRAAAAAEPAIDPVLLDILKRETAGHVAAVREHLARSAAEGIRVDAGMHHACHTLHGSITMAGVKPATGLTGALNQFIEAVHEHGARLDAAERDCCARAVDAIELHIASLEDAGAQAPATAELEAQLLALTERYSEVQEPVDGEPADEESADEDTIHEFGGAVAADEPMMPDATPAAAEPAEPAGQPPARRAVAAVDPDYDAEIAGIFCEEAAEILEASDSALQTLAADSGAVVALADLQRYLHTLKGGARMAGLSAMGDLSHDLESLLIRINAGSAGFTATTLELLQASIDELHRLRESVLDGAPAPADPELMAHIAGAAGARAPAEAAPDAAAVEAASAPAAEAAAAADDTVGEAPAGDTPLHIPAPAQLGELADDLIRGKAPATPAPLPDSLVQSPAAVATAEGQRREMARVDSAMLEDLLNNAGEISISHSRLKQQVSSIQFNLEELGQTVQRLQQQLRLLEMETEAQILFKHQDEAKDPDRDFDPLELDRYSTIQQLSRGLAETASDVSSIKDLLQNIAGDTETILSQQQRVAAELQDSLMRTRMVPFEQHVPRLQRLVRQQAQENGKQVELMVRGSSGELDRQVMERMIAPFEHMLRNAIVHGIEAPVARTAAGKPANATITISFRREGAHVLIDVADDGAGVDLERVRNRAIDKGVVRPDQELTDEELAQLILRTGLSTADRLTQSAGRGIGMDVVVNEIGKLGGTLGIATTTGKGCTFTIRLPYTLAITQAFVVRCGPESFALPLPTVEGVVRISYDEFTMRMESEDATVEYGGLRYRLRHLGPYLGLAPARITPEQERVSLALVEAGENSTAFITDDTSDAREIVIKPVGPQLAGIRGIAGATILGDGRIVVILDAPAIARMPVPEVDAEEILRAEEDNLPPLALVVDDSITMRRVTQRLLERNGMRVLTAKDGIEALELLNDHRPRIILLDVEMPRMDGYEFAGRVRNNPLTADLPIIMVTSRSGAKHRARAIELGVNDYLGKPYQEPELLEAIRAQLGEGLGSAPATKAEEHAS